MQTDSLQFDVVVIGGGHAGAEPAWAGANLGARVALVTMDVTKIGTMSCNPAIGGLAKGQMVREIDALGGLMGLATDATGIQFRMLNSSKGPAVWGPRAQCDKYRYAREVQRLIAMRGLITVIGGTAERMLLANGRVAGVEILRTQGGWLGGVENSDGLNRKRLEGVFGQAGEVVTLTAGAVVLTTGTFMRGLMHTGERKTEGGRVGEASAIGVSGALKELGFELGRLKTGTPPRLAAETINFDGLELQPGDDDPVPFSDLSPASMPNGKFPHQEQRPCHLTATCEESHALIRANLHRAPMYNGQIETAGPRYCPSIEDKVVRFADRHSHHVYLEPESLDTNEIYCNGISTSLPADVQEFVVHHLPGCENAKILKHGYAVEYDMVWPHQIDATCMTKRCEGLFLAGQINGTSGYEEAAGQGLIAGLNAVRLVRGQEMVRLRRDQAYIGVMMDDLVTKTPREPYRMFSSRAEYRLLLRADNTDERLTPLGREWGLVDDVRWAVFEQKLRAVDALREHASEKRIGGQKMIDWMRRAEVDVAMVADALTQGGWSLGDSPSAEKRVMPKRMIAGVLADMQYAGYVARQGREVERLASQERVPLPADYNYREVTGLRNEAKQVLTKFKPTTMGQAGRLAGITPADLMLLSVSIGRT
jgi:tRNA uridine 5-carboxymethylaminomethyl modification enzyme